MPKYVTVDFFRQHSRIDTEGEDEYLAQCIDAAEDTVARDLQVADLSALADSGGKIPASIKQAVLMLAGTNFENRENEAPVQMHADPHYWHLVRPYIQYKGAEE